MIDLAKADQGERPLKSELNHNHLCLYINAHYLTKKDNKTLLCCKTNILK